MSSRMTAESPKDRFSMADDSSVRLSAALVDLILATFSPRQSYTPGGEAAPQLSSP
jgi:hypothetical protein